MGESKLYKISARYKKSVYQEEQYINKLSNGKKVIFEKTTFFRWGNFEIELTEKEKGFSAFSCARSLEHCGIPKCSAAMAITSPWLSSMLILPDNSAGGSNKMAVVLISPENTWRFTANEVEPH